MINDGGANGFDLDSLRLSQDFGQTIGVKKTVLQYPIRRPGKQEFVRTHPSGEYRFQTATLELKDDGEIYMVAKSLWDELAGELRPTLLLTTINTQGTVSLWPCRCQARTGVTTVGTGRRSTPPDSRRHAG